MPTQKALEWVVGTYLSQDKVAMQEIFDEVDQHTSNQIIFKLPGWEDAQKGIKSDGAAFGRLIAKKFVFRLMYGGSAYSYANDPDFTEVSTSQKFWQKVIDKFYEKYKGFAKWHEAIIKEAVTTGQLVMPTGRIYKYEMKRNYAGELEAPQTIIKNYPVQGLGADIMSIARVSFAKRFKEAHINGVMVNTVHDSLIVDIANKELDKVAALFHSVFLDLPKNFEKIFNIPFNLPLRVEVSFGHNMKELQEWTKKTTL